MKYIFLKEVINPEGREFSAFTALTDALKSEGLFYLYQVIWHVIRDKNKFQTGNIIIRKIKLNKLNYGKRKN